MKCEACPVREALACLGERHNPVCKDVADGMPGRAAQLVALAENPPEPPRPPTWPRMARSFLVALLRHLWDPRKAPRPVRAAREAECRANACGKYDAAKDACASCGCGYAVPGGLALKRSWATEACPQGRWGPA